MVINTRRKGRGGEGRGGEGRGGEKGGDSCYTLEICHGLTERQLLQNTAGCNLYLPISEYRIPR